MSPNEYESVLNALEKKLEQKESQLAEAVEILKYIAQRDWAANTKEPHKWVNEFVAVAREFLEKYGKD